MMGKVKIVNARSNTCHTCSFNYNGCNTTVKRLGLQSCASMSTYAVHVVDPSVMPALGRLTQACVLCDSTHVRCHELRTALRKEVR